MDLIKAFFDNVYNVKGIIEWGGTLAIVAVVFAETGLLVGFFLPGDSLLFTAGIFAAAGQLNIWHLVFWTALSAVLGDATGYWIGYKAGEPLYRRKQTWFFRRDHLLRTKEFYERHGGKTIVIARFVPIIRTFAPVVAGVAKMRYARFFSFNVWGGIGWVLGICLGGYWLGRSIPDIDRYLHIVIGIIIFLSLIPVFVEVWRGMRNRGKGPRRTRGARRA